MLEAERIVDVAGPSPSRPPPPFFGVALVLNFATTKDQRQIGTDLIDKARRTLETLPGVLSF